MAGLNRFVGVFSADTLQFSLLVGLFLASAARGVAQEPPLQQGPQLKVTVNRVNVGVTVTDSRGEFVSGPHRNDFRVFDNEVELLIACFLPVEGPAQFFLMLEPV